MNVTQYLRQLEAAGFQAELLDQAVALAGARRMVYAALCSAVEEQGLPPAEALRSVEDALR